jgi:hypothetical protein
LLRGPRRNRDVYGKIISSVHLNNKTNLKKSLILGIAFSNTEKLYQYKKCTFRQNENDVIYSTIKFKALDIC